MIYVAFYKGSGGFFDWLIRLWTRSKYSHCELVFQNGRRFTALAGHGTGWCRPIISYDLLRYMEEACEAANTLEKAVGHAVTPPTFIGMRPDWDMVAVRGLDEVAIKTFCDNALGRPYDWLGIFFSQLFPFKIHSPNSYYCSEVCEAALKAGGHRLDIIPEGTSPASLWKWLTLAW